MQKKLNNKGFTIVEVLIVLAIAGAILAAILLAVPPLQNNAKNAQLKTAANNVVAAISNATAANNGAIPGTGKITYSAPVLTVGTATSNLPGQITAVTEVKATAGDLTAASASTIYVSLFGCDSSGNGKFNATSAGAWGVQYYAIGASAPTCIGA